MLSKKKEITKTYEDIKITSRVKLENIQNGVILGRRWEAEEIRALHEISRCENFRALREIHIVRENALHFWLPSWIGFLPFCLSNSKGDQPGSFMHGLTRQNCYQVPVKTTKIAT